MINLLHEKINTTASLTTFSVT